MPFFSSCRVCGCTEYNACVDTKGRSCYWVADALCSHCAQVDPSDPHPELPVLALSIRQPWLWAIMHLGKNVENRTWPTRYRGRICLHAARGMTLKEFDHALDLIDQIRPLGEVGTIARRDDCTWSIRHERRGGIVATARLKWCISHHDSPWFFGPYGFELEDIQPVSFVEVKGSRGLFDWRRNLVSC